MQLSWRWTCTVLIGLALPSLAQTKRVASMVSEGPAQIGAQILILPEQVVEEQWPATLATVHPPKELIQVEPGQCIRFGVTAGGDARDQLLMHTQFAFEFSFAGNTQTFPAEPAQSVKLTTPFMFDFLEQTLFKNRIPKEFPKDGALAASAHAARWCAPTDVRDGTASVQGTAVRPDGKRVELKRRKIEIKTFETARKKAPFKNMKDVDDWLAHYHEVPDPAQLLLALRLVANDQEARDATNLTAFFVAAFKAHPAAAEELMQRLPTEDHWTRLIGTAILGWAGYQAALRDSLSQQDKALLAVVQLPDAYAMTLDRNIGSRQDMLWAIFFATGRIEPVRVIAGELAWSEDYAKLMEHGRQVRASGQKSSNEFPDYAARGVAYGAAGWSMSSLASHDALLYDYTEALQASPDTPPAVKKELANLFTNPAFKYPASPDQK